MGGTKRAIIIGAGIGGMSAAMSLAARGLEVCVVEKAGTPGGKMRELSVGGHPIDVGPTVLTLRSVFDRLFAACGQNLADHVSLAQCERLARHAWDEAGHFDLFADRARAADEIAHFFSPEDGRNYLAFCAEAQAIHDALDADFMQRDKPTPLALARALGPAALMRLRPFATYWQALTKRFRDPRLAQLFGRYATYCGSSPFNAPATLMLIAHVEQEGVWLVEGGMHRLAQAMASVITAMGGQMRYGAAVEEILTERGRCSGVRLAGGERLMADIVISNAEVGALGDGLFGAAAQRSVTPVKRADRALSAVTFALRARTGGQALARHSVFFSHAYKAEFDAINAGRTPDEPTVYVCAQDRDDAGKMTPVALLQAAPDGRERLFLIVNAPPTGDTAAWSHEEIAQCQKQAFATLSRCGLALEVQAQDLVAMSPRDHAALFPATGGALYGRAMNSPWATFRRSGTRTRLPGLYLAGGSVHPGAGVPMVALSGMIAAQAALAEMPARASVSMNLSPPAAMPGGMSMR